MKSVSTRDLPARWTAEESRKKRCELLREQKVAVVLIDSELRMSDAARLNDGARCLFFVKTKL